MALNLGLGSDVAHTSSERERAMHRITWNSVAQLQQLTASSTFLTLGLATPLHSLDVTDLPLLIRSRICSANVHRFHGTLEKDVPALLWPMDFKSLNAPLD